MPMSSETGDVRRRSIALLPLVGATSGGVGAVGFWREVVVAAAVALSAAARSGAAVVAPPTSVACNLFTAGAVGVPAVPSSVARPELAWSHEESTFRMFTGVVWGLGDSVGTGFATIVATTAWDDGCGGLAPPVPRGVSFDTE